MKKKGVCIIGSGRAGMIHAKNFRSKVSEAELIAVMDPIEDVVKQAASELEIEKYYTKLEDVLNDSNIDAVIVVTPTRFHRDIVIASAKASKHILCEKPMAMDTNECEDMITACKENNVKLQIGFMRRFDKGFMEAKAAVEKGAIGEVVLIKSLTRGPSEPREWMYDLKKSNGPLAEVNSHDIDSARWFAESEFKNIYAVGGNYRCKGIAETYPDFYDNVVLNGKFENGTQFSIDGAQYVKYGYDSRMEILGTDGLIMIGQTRENSLMVCSKDQTINERFTKSWSNLFDEAYLEEDKHFIQCILEDKDPKVTGYDGKMAVEVVNNSNLSLREDRIVRLVR